MPKNYLWTKLKARLQLIHVAPASNSLNSLNSLNPLNWVFLAGGPGIGSESLSPLTQLLNLPGNLWHLDLPGDGSNLTEDDTTHFSRWQEALVEAVNALDNVVLAGHSTGGMYALATPELQNSLAGLVLMGSAPNANWQPAFLEVAQKNPLPGTEELYQRYAKKPDNETLKKITVLSAPYIFTKEGLKKDISFLDSLPYNFRSCDWSAQHFDSTYKAKWTPKIPTLIFAGDEDRITPLKAFSDQPDFQSETILIRKINQAGHFPWIENPADVVAVFNEYYQKYFN